MKGRLSPSQEKIRAPSGLLESSVPMGDKLSPDALVSVLLHLVSLPSWPLTLIRARFSPFSLSFLPHHFPLLSPEISLLLSLSSPACVLPSETVNVRQPQNHSSQLVRPAPSGWQQLTLMGDEPRWERLSSYPTDLGPGAPY